MELKPKVKKKYKTGNYKKKENGKNATGRPSKLTEELVGTFQEVVDQPNNIYLTDEQLFGFLIEALERKHFNIIGYRNFQEYKNSKNKYEKTIFQKFQRIMKKALSEELKTLMQSLKEGRSGEWQKYAWIIERKFDDWNIRQKLNSEVKVTVGFSLTNILRAAEAKEQGEQKQ